MRSHRYDRPRRHHRDLSTAPSAATLVEVIHSRIKHPLEWKLSRLVVEPVTEPLARRAAAMLAAAKSHGHKYAMLAATAVVAVGPVTVLTSDPDDLTALCGERATVIKI